MNDSEYISVGLTLEDEFTLTRIKNDAHELKGRERDQYLMEQNRQTCLPRTGF